MTSQASIEDDAREMVREILKSFENQKMGQSTTAAIKTRLFEALRDKFPQVESFPVEFAQGADPRDLVPANLFTMLLMYGVVVNPKDLEGKESFYVPGIGMVGPMRGPGVVMILPEKPVEMVTMSLTLP